MNKIKIIVKPWPQTPVGLFLIQSPKENIINFAFCTIITRKRWCPRTGKGQRLMGILAVTGYGSV